MHHLQRCKMREYIKTSDRDGKTAQGDNCLRLAMCVGVGISEVACVDVLEDLVLQCPCLSPHCNRMHSNEAVTLCSVLNYPGALAVIYGMYCGYWQLPCVYNSSHECQY